MLWLCAFHFLQGRIGDLSLKENYRYGLGMTQAFSSLFIPLLMYAIAEQLSIPIAEERELSELEIIIWAFSGSRGDQKR